ncbi:OmpA family protein [Aliivibrio salmonicida]|nr:OmpA family protein [Aliivibrio salmonicida]
MPFAFLLFPFTVLAAPYASLEFGISNQIEYEHINNGDSSGLSWGGGLGYEFENLSTEIVYKNYPQLSFRNISGDFLGSKTSTVSFNLKYHPCYLETDLLGFTNSNFTPFIGVGFGVNYNNSSGMINNIAFDSNHIGIHPVFMFGAAYPVNSNLDLVFKYQNELSSSNIDISYLEERKENIDDFSIGLKYKFNGPNEVVITENVTIEHNYLNQVISLSDDVSGLLFMHDSSIIENADYLIDMMSKIELSTIQVIEIKGYTDSSGPSVYNDRLSLDRAVATMSFLESYLSENGYTFEDIPIVTTGFGETMNIQSNETYAGRKMNRRVEIVIKFKSTLVKTEI